MDETRAKRTRRLEPTPIGQSTRAPEISAAETVRVDPSSGRDAADTPANTLSGRYRVEQRLGAGGMGDVYRAVDTRLGRAVAIKMGREQFSDRFEREARAISALNHPHVCILYDVGPNYLVMELVEGETVADRLRSGPLPVDLACLYASQIVAALAEAHRKGIIHRDLKPANIMIARSGIKVLDFGLAKSREDDTLTAPRMVLGTPAYMAPEQWKGLPADARSDIYAFGCVLYEMLTGNRVTPARPRFSSRTLETILRRCLDENPSRRWPSAVELEARFATLTRTGRRVRSEATAMADRSADQRPVVGAARSADPPTLVLAEWANTTGEADLDKGLFGIVASQLENASRLRLLSEGRVAHALRLMKRPVGASITPELAAEIGERTASAAVVESSIASHGAGYLLSVRARDWRTGELLCKEQAIAAAKPDVAKTLARLAQRFASRAAAALPGAEPEPSLPVDVTTASLEAWRSFSAAMKASQSRAQSPESVALLQRAIEMDPTFAMAHAALGRQQADLGEVEQGAQSIARSYELRDGVSEQENYYISFGYHRQVTRNLELARQSLESWAHRYPAAFYPHAFLSGFVSPGTGHYQRAIEEGLRALEIDPAFAIGYQNVLWACIYLHRLDEADALLRKADARGIDIRQFSLVRYALAFLRHDTSAMDREAARRHAVQHAQGSFEHQEALTLASQGRVREANRVSDRAVLLARQSGLSGRAALFRGSCAVWNALLGLDAEAQTRAREALLLARGRDADYGPALALALARQSDEARPIGQDLAASYPEDTSVQFSYVPTLRAVLALNDDRVGAALEATDLPASYELALPATAYFTGSFWGALYPLYMRGVALSRTGRPVDAAVVLRTVLGHPGLVVNDPIGPLARLQLARTLAAAGERAQSASEYEALLARWVDADADVPVVEQARAEYARIR